MVKRTGRQGIGVIVLLAISYWLLAFAFQPVLRLTSHVSLETHQQ